MNDINKKDNGDKEMGMALAILVSLLVLVVVIVLLGGLGLKGYY